MPKKKCLLYGSVQKARLIQYAREVWLIRLPLTLGFAVLPPGEGIWEKMRRWVYLCKRVAGGDKAALLYLVPIKLRQVEMNCCSLNSLAVA